MQSSPLFELHMERISSGGVLSRSHAKSLLRALNMAREYEQFEAATPHRRRLGANEEDGHERPKGASMHPGSSPA